MPAARGVKRSASKASTSAAATEPKNKKKRGVIQLDIPIAPKRKGCIYTCGQGDVGQLGLGEDVMETTKFKQVTALPNKMVDVIAGGMHTLALDSDGKIWSWGCNDEGALGRPTGDDEGTPGLVSLPGPAVAMSAGDSHSAALLEDGQVWAWGSFRDSHGSMGLVVRAREGKPCKEPARLPVPPAAGIASGGDHLVVLDTTGNVYTMGCGEQGQLGRLAQRSASRDARQGFGALLVPSKVVVKGGATRVWAGSHATFALSAGRVLAWGLNNYGQLGVTGEKRKTALYSPTECDALPGDEWQTLSAGQHHTLALDRAGRLHALGRCEYGRLGLGDRVGDAESLEPIPKLQNKKCVSISTGTCNSFAVTDEGEVFAWGMGSEGQLGTGGAADQLEPTPAPLPPAVSAMRVAAGGQHAALLVEDPNAQKEPSPTPEEEKEEEKVEEVAEEREEKEKEKRPTKRQKKEQDGEISSTSSAQSASVTDDQPEKVNGDEKKQTAMDVDETVTEKPEEIKEDTQTDTPNDEQETTEHTESEKESKDDMDTSSQDTVESEKEKDVEMKGVNGTDETNETSETKPKETGDETIASETAMVSA